MPRTVKKDKEPRRAIALGDTAMATIVSPDVSTQLSRGFKITVNGIMPQGQPSFAESAAAGEILRVAQRADGFAIGGWANYMEQRFGEEASQAIDAESGWNLKTLSVYRWLDKQVALPRRRMDRLTIKHHLIVASLTPTKQKEWLDRAANDSDPLSEPWTCAQLAKALADGEASLGDLAHWVIVLARSEADAQGLLATFTEQGRTAKLKIGRGGRKAKES